MTRRNVTGVTHIPSHDGVAILDFGSQYSQLIARRVRENHVFSILCRPDITADELQRMNVVGLIFSGGPASVYADGAPTCDPACTTCTTSCAKSMVNGAIAWKIWKL